MLENRVFEAIGQRFTNTQKKISHLSDRLKDPVHLLTKGEARLQLLNQRLDTVLENKTSTSKTRFEQAARLLEASSFQRVLDRGFAFVTGPDGHVMRSAQDYKDGDGIKIRLADGSRDAMLGKETSSKKTVVKKANEKPSSQGDLF